jgi:tetratricopeptide (TPR) repeat protein
MEGALSIDRRWIAWMSGVMLPLLLVTTVLPRLIHSAGRDWAGLRLAAGLLARNEPRGVASLAPYRVETGSAKLLDLVHMWGAGMISGDTGSSWLPRDLGIAELAIGQDSAAREVLLASGDQVADMHLALLAVQLGDWHEAAARFPWPVPPAEAAQLLLEIAGRQADRPAVALPYAELAVQLDGSSGRAHYERGLLYQHVGQNDKALADYERGIELCPNCWQPYYYRAALCQIIVCPGQANVEHDIRTALSLAPGNQYVEAQWAFWLGGHGPTPDALAQFERVVQIWPEYLDPYLALAELYWRSGQPERALAVLDEASRRFSDPVQAAQIANQRRRLQAQP